MVTQSEHRAVLMGDLVGSEAALSTDQLHAVFNKAIEDQNTASTETLVSPLTITLGDEFQGLTTTLTQAALIARDLRYRLLSEEIDCRFVIGSVQIETPINPKKAWNMMGPGLGRARDKLNQKKADQFYRFSTPQAPKTEPVLDALGFGLSRIEAGWTKQQRADIIELMRGKSPAELAESRNVSVHSIYKVRASGDFDVYETQWKAMLLALDMLDTEKGHG